MRLLPFSFGLLVMNAGLTTCSQPAAEKVSDVRTLRPATVLPLKTK
ncbi:hypothetical protein [Asticcacaulis sp.]|nr:hypothetical protein [Asticcacaulis sp.]